MTRGDKTSAADESDVAIEQVSNDTSEATARESRPGQLTAADLLRSELDGDVKIRRAKKSKNVASGICHILATFNNTKVSFSDKAGAVISWSSAGKNNFRGSRKSTAYAAQVAVQDAARTAMSHGLKEIDVRIKGPGLGRDAAVRALQSIGLQVNSITDVTPLPHNGCRPKKPRRA
jgi:small subunit ribosomal protein S11